MNDETPLADGAAGAEAGADLAAAPEVAATATDPAPAGDTPAEGDRTHEGTWRSVAVPRLADPVHWVNGMGEHEAAIVTYVHGATGSLNLGVFTRRGVYEHVQSAPHDEAGSVFTWHWPEEPDLD